MSGIKSVKGTRDFYPDDMRLRNWIADKWREVSLRNGFEEYDAPIFEYLDLFTIKSGDEIAEQLFSFTDRGGRNLAIRPEITPSLARMVNAKVNTLPRPIKWFSIPRLCRAENPQKGRLREFFQWNVDVIGVDDVLADAECIYTCIDFLREVGLTPKDAVVRIGSRPLAVAILDAAEISVNKHDQVLALLDKRGRTGDDGFFKGARDAGLDEPQIELIDRFQELDHYQEVIQFFDHLVVLRVMKFSGKKLLDGLDLARGIAGETSDSGSKLVGKNYGSLSKQEVEEIIGKVRQQWLGDDDEVASFYRDVFSDAGVQLAVTSLQTLWNHLDSLNVLGYCKLDFRIVRGLAYYTGIVYEVFDADAQLRAVAGGGRYDNLLEVLGGPQVGATGFGMGDVVLGILLEEKGKLPDSFAAADYFVIDGDGCEMSHLLKVVGELRKRGASAEFSYKRANTGKQLKDANRRGARSAVIVRGPSDPIGVKNLASGHQAEQSLDEFLSLLDKAL